VLSPYRVIDLSDERGLLCGQILADHGADVIQVEPQGGSPARRLGPWLNDEPGPEHSLFWWAYARNKRSIVLDVEDSSDRAALLELVRGADFFIESDHPGRLASLGLGYDDLAAINPGLVYVSISPFGQRGPKADWVASDLTIMASAGHAHLCGDADCPPVRVRVPQAHAHAGADAAVGALIAHFERLRTGRGQHVDISAQQSVTLATQFRSLDTPLEEAPAERASGGLFVKGEFIPLRHALLDGWVVLGPAMLPSTGHFMTRLVQWTLDEGYGDPAALEEDWGTVAIRFMTGELSMEDIQAGQQSTIEFFATRSKTETMRAAVERKLLLAPVLSLDEIIDGDQMTARAFPVEQKFASHSEPVRFPGPSAKFSVSPISYRQGPPGVDEHGDELRKESKRSPAAHGSEPIGARPLEGVKILDLFWVLAGPGSTRMLADYGATVIHIESTQHVDTCRVIPPYQFANPHPEGAAAFQSANANKLGMTLDIASEAGRGVLHSLVRWADVVTESFAPGVVAEYGLSYEDLRKIDPEIIMISSCLMGQTGPWRNFSGFGNLAAAVTGYQHLASWPDRPPSGPYGAYTDFIAVRYNAIAILAALDHRRRTGRGQYIDMAQAEAGFHFIAPAFLDYTVNGKVSEAVGNWDALQSPHDFYPAKGDGCWVAIAVETEAQWKALCDLIGRMDLAGRREETSVVDAALSGWTEQREAAEVVAALQERRIPAHESLDMPGLFADPQLKDERGHYVEIPHSIYQTTTIESSRLSLSRSDPAMPESALSVGRDTDQVLREILGMSDGEIAALREAGALA